MFDVTDYGATGDDATDNTDAFSRCIHDIIEAGGGQMYLPNGIYRGHITIPGISEWITIEVVGESKPTPIWGTIGAFPFGQNGTILKSLSETGSAVIYADSGPEGLYGIFSGVHVVIRNLDVRTYDNPGINGIDLLYAAQCTLENVFINTDSYNVQAAQPTHGTCGLITPKSGNAAWTMLRNVVVTGYGTGILVHEHTDGDSIALGSNLHGLVFATAHHASRFGRVCSQRCTHHVTVTGKHGFSIAQLNTEQPGPNQTDAKNAWQTLISDVNDPDNLGHGDITYWVVVGNVGAVDTFAVTGGSGIQVRRIGSDAQ